MSQEKKKPDPVHICKNEFESELGARREIPDVARAIMDCFSEKDPMAHLDLPAMPDEPTVIHILEMLNGLIYPGYHGRNKIEHHNLIYYVGEVSIKIFDKLSQQISRAFRNDCEPETREAPCIKCDEYGYTLALRFLETVPEIRKQLATDVLAAFGGDPAAKSSDEIIFCYPGLKAITIYRVAHELFKLGVPIIPRIMTEFAHRETGIDIHPGAQIGDGFFIDHGTGVVIGETTVIGKNVQIYQGVTLGALRFPKDEEGNLIRGIKRHPTIEDEVTIYGQAIILGDLTIGKGSVIGGNVWLTQSVPPFSSVQNEPVKIRLRQNGKSDRVVDYRIDPAEK